VGCHSRRRRSRKSPTVSIEKEAFTCEDEEVSVAGREIVGCARRRKVEKRHVERVAAVWRGRQWIRNSMDAVILKTIATPTMYEFVELLRMPVGRPDERVSSGRISTTHWLRPGAG
jgi:hypothetical protein